MTKRTTDFPFEIVDTTGLTDSDWTEINRLKAAYSEGGEAGYAQALDALLVRDPIQTVAVLAAFFPDDMRNVIKDQMAEQGIDEDDLRAILRDAAGRSRKQ